MTEKTEKTKKNEKPRRTSLIIAEIIESCVEDGTVTVGEFLGKMGHRALVIAILVFALSAVVAGVVPGFSTLVALPVIFIALQIIIGRRTICLPEKIRSKHISPRLIRGALYKTIPTLLWMEKFLRPRAVWLTSGIFERIIAFFIMILAVILSLPIPAGNFLPSITIALLALALLERDGVLLLLTIGTLFFTGTLMIELIFQAVHYASQLISGF